MAITLISREQLKRIVPNISVKGLNTYIERLNDAMGEFGIFTDMRIAAFIAQVAHESGSFHYVEEIASGAAYEHRQDLGNLRPEAMFAAHKHASTTGRFYKG